MKNTNPKWLAIAVASAMAMANSTQGQTYNFSTGSTTYLGAGFNSSQITGTGLQVTTGTGYESGYYDIAGATATPSGWALSTADTEVTLILTVSGPASNVAWMGTGINVNDTFSSTDPYPLSPLGANYSGYNNPGSPAGFSWVQNSPTSYTLTETGNLAPGFLTQVQAGTAAVYGLSLGIDPQGNAQNVTFNSLTFSPSSVPEPNTLAITSLGIVGLLALRRRNLKWS